MAHVPSYHIHKAQLLTCIVGCVRAVSPAVSATKSMCRTAVKFRSLSTATPSLSILPIFPLKCKNTTFCMAQKSEGKRISNRLQIAYMQLRREAKSQKSIYMWRCCHTYYTPSSKTFGVGWGAPIQLEIGHLHRRIWEGGTPRSPFLIPHSLSPISHSPCWSCNLARERGSLALKASDKAPSGKEESWALVLAGSSVTLTTQLFTDWAAVWWQPSRPPLLASNDQCHASCL